METYEILGREYPVTGYVTAPRIGTVPLVDLPMLSDDEWIRTARENAVHNYTRKFGHPPVSGSSSSASRIAVISSGWK